MRVNPFISANCGPLKGGGRCKPQNVSFGAPVTVVKSCDLGRIVATACGNDNVVPTGPFAKDLKRLAEAVKQKVKAGKPK